jgi:hypothetical protein
MMPTPSRLVVVAIVAVSLAALTFVVLIIRWNRDSPIATPEGTVRSFLIWGVVDHNGFEACRYLTRAAVLESHALGYAQDADCQAMFDTASLRLGSVQIAEESQVKRLSYRVSQKDRHAEVTVTGDGASRMFLLRRGTAEELDEFNEPPTPWRIDSGVSALLPRLR